MTAPARNNGSGKDGKQSGRVSSANNSAKPATASSKAMDRTTAPGTGKSRTGRSGQQRTGNGKSGARQRTRPSRERSRAGGAQTTRPRVGTSGTTTRKRGGSAASQQNGDRADTRGRGGFGSARTATRTPKTQPTRPRSRARHADSSKRPNTTARHTRFWDRLRGFEQLPAVRRTRALVSRVPMVGVVMSLLAVGLAATLWLSIATVSGSYQLQQGQAELGAMNQHKEELVREVSTLNSSPVIQRRAVNERGMVPGPVPAHLVSGPNGDVRVIGEPEEAQAPAPPPPPPGKDQAEDNASGHGSMQRDDQADGSGSTDDTRSPDDQNAAGNRDRSAGEQDAGAP